MTEARAVGKGRRALGRGLDALIAQPPETGVREVEVSRIEPNPNQPRQRFERKALEDLAESIREHGIVQPLVVTAAGDGHYRLIVGERRWQAARLAGLERVPVVVKDATDRQTLELALVENVQRADLNPLEEAAAYQRLIQDHGLTQAEVAKGMGKSRVAIANTLRLLALPGAIQAAIIDGRITEGHGRALLGAADERAQVAIMERVIRDDLNVRQTEELVRRLQGPPTMGRPSERNPDIAALEDQLRRSLGTKVSIAPGRRGGRIVIEYYSDDDFEGLYHRLLAGS